MELIALAGVAAIAFTAWMLVKAADDFDDGYDKND